MEVITMNNNKVQNTKVEVPSTIEMNNENYLNDILETEKNMSVNMTIALNEASNKMLFDQIFEIYKDVKLAQRDLYNMAFQKGWYSLEKAENTKIDEKLNELNQKLNQLS